MENSECSYICPLSNYEGGNCYCYKEHCAWWDEEHKQCAIMTIALKESEEPT